MLDRRLIYSTKLYELGRADVQSHFSVLLWKTFGKFKEKLQVIESNPFSPFFRTKCFIPVLLILGLSYRILSSIKLSEKVRKIFAGNYLQNLKGTYLQKLEF